MATWYVLENGVAADPDEVAPDAAGVLKHKSGVAVAMGPHGPKSRGVDAGEERAKASKPALSTKDMKPGAQPKQVYTTRESKAD